MAQEAGRSQSQKLRNLDSFGRPGLAQPLQFYLKLIPLSQMLRRLLLYLGPARDTYVGLYSDLTGF